jgi:hypothetical protein
LGKSINLSLTREEISIIRETLRAERNNAIAQAETMRNRNPDMFPNAPMTAEIAESKAEMIDGILRRVENV